MSGPHQVWSEEENLAIVSDYFDMLKAELRGETYNKSEHRRKLANAIGRSDGSIERKHQNISAVLKALGSRPIKGYKPLFDYQSSLEETVAEALHSNAELLDGVAVSTELAEAPAIFFETPPTLKNAPAPNEAEQAARTASKFDVAGRDERNRRLGLEGERRALHNELQTLRSKGRGDLAERVEWVSQTQGDGAGYDIASFTPDGGKRLIEVKTTNGWERTPFYISRNELRVASEVPDEWRLVRLWNFSDGVRAFELTPPLERHVELTPTTFQASFP